jgi:CDP-diacylglycerol--glycerol-3-phosphate 3-phosphatidyltransferase
MNNRNKLEFGKVLTVPNFLSVSRLVLLPLILFFIATKQYFAALAFMIISWITDALDGYIARKTNQVTNLGKILDHFVDKIWVGTILVTLVITRNLPWWIAGPVILRDILIVVGSSIIIQKKNYIFSSHILGKIAGLFFAVLMVVYLLDFSHVILIRNILLIIVSALIIISFIFYLYRFIKAIKTKWYEERSS